MSYYLDGTETSSTTFDALPATYYFHDLITSKDAGRLVTKSNAFSTKSNYESWGVSNNIPVAKMNSHDARVDFLADSLGIRAKVLNNETPSSDVVANYQGLVSASYNALFPSSALYKSCKFYEENCDPSTCSNSSVGFLGTYLTLPTWASYPISLFLEDNSEAWEPSCFLPNNNGCSVTLRPYSYPFFVTPPWQQWVKKATVVIPQGKTKQFVPFNNNLHWWSNRISSWIIIPSV